MLQQRTTALSLVLALGLVAAGCSSGGGVTPTTVPAGTTTMPDTTGTTAAPGSTAPTTTSADPEPGLLVWVDEARRAAVETAADAFAAATGVPVRVEVVGFGDIGRRMKEEAGTGTAADVFLGTHEWVADLAEAGVIAAVDAGARTRDFAPAGLDAFSLDGRLYGLPYSVEAIALFRNTDLVPDAPATFEDLLAVCDDLGDEVERCLAIPAADPYYNYPFLASTGGYVFGRAPEGGYDPADVGLDDADAVAGFEFLSALVADGYLDPAVDYGTMTRLFFEGRAAFMWTAQWAVPNADEAVAAGTLPGYAVSLLPEILGHEATPLVRAQGFMVAAQSLHPEEARRFLLDYLATTATMVALYEADPRPPAFLAALEALAPEPRLEAFAASAAAGTPIPSIGEMALVWAPLGEAFLAVYQQTATPEEALAGAAAQVRIAVADN